MVRGTTVDAARRFVERRKGGPAWEAFRASISDEQRRMLDEPVRRLHWYDLESYGSVLQHAAQHLAPEAPDAYLTDVGRFVLDDGVGTLYRAFFAIASPSFVIRGSAMLWGLFFKGNKLKVLRHDRKRVEAVIVDSTYCARPLCLSIGGGMLSALAHAGARQPRLDHHRCRSEGGQRCEFHMVWD